MKLLVIRHAESEGNLAQVLQGQQEHPLSFEGHRQAQELAKFLTEQSWPPTHLYSSPLQRSVQTAHYCAGDVPVQLHHGLIEIHNGILQGLTWEEAEHQYPILCRELINSDTWIPIPESESPTQVFDRAQAFIDWMWCHHQNCDRLWLFSHGGVMQHLVARLMGCDRLWGISIPPTALFEFEINLEHWTTQRNDRFTGHLFKLVRFNQTPHL